MGLRGVHRNGLAFGVGFVAACACPTIPCERSIEIELRATRWTRGTHVLNFPQEVQPQRCEVQVVTDGVPPTAADITCDGVVLRSGFLQDTGFAVPADPLELLLFAPASFEPELLRVEVDASTVSLPLDWRAIGPPAGTCRTGCATAATALDLGGTS